MVSLDLVESVLLMLSLELVEFLLLKGLNLWKGLIPMLNLDLVETLILGLDFRNGLLPMLTFDWLVSVQENNSVQKFPFKKIIQFKSSRSKSQDFVQRLKVHWLTSFKVQFKNSVQFKI